MKLLADSRISTGEDPIFKNKMVTGRTAIRRTLGGRMWRLTAVLFAQLDLYWEIEWVAQVARPQLYGGLSIRGGEEWW